MKKNLEEQERKFRRKTKTVGFNATTD